MASSHKSGRPVGSKRRRPSGRWQVCVTRGLRADGSRRTVYETVDTEEEADARLAELAVELGSRPDLDAAAERMGRLLRFDGDADNMQFPPPTSANGE